MFGCCSFLPSYSLAVFRFFFNGICHLSSKRHFSFLSGQFARRISLRFFLSLVGSFAEKGSLVETVHIDYKKQEIRVLRYNLLKRQFKIVIPVEGFSWDVLWGGRSANRLRMFQPDGKRIVICEGVLGWTVEDLLHLESALSKVVAQDDWWVKGF